MNYTPDELDERLRRREDQGEYDGYAADPLKVHAANVIRDLRVALASQIDITNTERASKERLEAILREQQSKSRSSADPAAALSATLATMASEGRDSGASRVEALERLYMAATPFAEIMLGSSGRIPTERLSAAQWHELTRAFVALQVPTQPARSICVGCDGCGWCEGSPAFTCTDCGGTGLKPLPERNSAQDAAHGFDSETHEDIMRSGDEAMRKVLKTNFSE